MLKRHRCQVNFCLIHQKLLMRCASGHWLKELRQASARSLLAQAPKESAANSSGAGNGAWAQPIRWGVGELLRAIDGYDGEPAIAAARARAPAPMRDTASLAW
jgi:hypothetical protein